MTRKRPNNPGVVRTLAFGVILLLTVAACGRSARSATPSVTAHLTSAPASFGDPKSYDLTAGDQHTDGTELIISSATLHRAGWIAVHRDVNGAPGIVLGVSPLLAAGPHRNVLIHLGRRLPARTKVMPVIHIKDTRAASFEYPDGDPPATVNGRVVVVTVELT